MAADAYILNEVSDFRSSESLLLDHIERIRNVRSGQFAVHLHLSQLGTHNRRPYHIRIAGRSFDSLLNAHDAQLYLLSNNDLVLICRNVPVEEVDFVVEKVRMLFKGDPITRPGTHDRFASWYDLEIEYEDFLQLAEEMDRAVGRRPVCPEDASAGRGYGAATAGQPLDPFSLAKVYDSLARIRIAELIEQQSAVIIGVDGTESILFDEHFVSIAALQRKIAPGFNLISDLWLFQHLTEIIDKRILAVIGRKNLARRKADISVNLNVATVDTPEFQIFDSHIGNGANRMVIEFQMIDVFADLGAFRAARDRLRERGYRVLLDSLNPMAFLQPDAAAGRPRQDRMGPRIRRGRFGRGRGQPRRDDRGDRRR
jgi:hypothetical protein